MAKFGRILHGQIAPGYVIHPCESELGVSILSQLPVTQFEWPQLNFIRDHQSTDAGLI